MARPKKELQHGTNGGWYKGCRCQECKDAHNAYDRARYHMNNARRQTREILSNHGTNTAYQHGCRCEQCRTAHRIAASKYRGRYKEKKRAWDRAHARKKVGVSNECPYRVERMIALAFGERQCA